MVRGEYRADAGPYRNGCATIRITAIATTRKSFSTRQFTSANPSRFRRVARAPRSAADRQFRKRRREIGLRRTAFDQARGPRRRATVHLMLVRVRVTGGGRHRANAARGLRWALRALRIYRLKA